MMSPELSHCRSCGANIYWVKTESGKNMPVDSMPTETGNIIFVSEMAHVIKAGEAVPEDARRYVSHFVTCKNAAHHRRKKI